ncbi:MAG: hypothetical protein ACRC1Z_04845 [Waterburya sp.]
MEIVTLTTAIATIFITKVIEKPGENLGQVLWDKTQNLVGKLKGKSDKFAGLLEGNQQQPLADGEAILELQALANKDLEIAQAIREVEAEVKQNPDLANKIQTLAQAIQNQSQSPTVQNNAKIAEFAKQVFQGNNNFNAPVTFN